MASSLFDNMRELDIEINRENLLRLLDDDITFPHAMYQMGYSLDSGEEIWKMTRDIREERGDPHETLKSAMVDAVLKYREEHKGKNQPA